jgi:hypothetical protein
MGVFTIHPLLSRGNNGKPHVYSSFLYDPVFQSGSDTLPQNKKITDEKTDTAKAAIIKEVPKSRKQERPIPLTGIPVIKPIKIIKPKILKPVIRVLN